MSKITRPKKAKIVRAPKRPAWLYPEGTKHVSDNGTYVVGRNYGTEVFDPSNGLGGLPDTVHTRTRRFWKKVEVTNGEV